MQKMPIFRAFSAFFLNRFVKCNCLKIALRIVFFMCVSSASTKKINNLADTKEKVNVKKKNGDVE